jgi:transcriptional regulator with XRE-family HTH domain
MRLRVLRAERGLSLTEAAERAGIQRQTLALLERGERHPHDVTLAKLARAYGVPVEDLLAEPVPLAEAPDTARSALEITRDAAENAQALAENIAREGTRVREGEDSSDHDEVLVAMQAERSAHLEELLDEVLIYTTRLTPELFRHVLEILVEHEHQIEDLYLVIEGGYVECGLKARELDG